MRPFLFSLIFSACDIETKPDSADPIKQCSTQDSLGDGIDSNCDGIDGIDFDHDGYASIASGGDDCNDNDASTHPQALEICDSIDNNCNGFTDDEDEQIEISSTTTWYADTDNDGFGSTTTIQACIMPEGYTNNNQDCDDDNASIHPQATEICDATDNNCNTLMDEDDPTLDNSTLSTWYSDIDNDGFGGTISLLACTSPEGYTNNNQDCADEDASIHPQATEICDTIDNNCDTLIDDDDPLLDISSTTTWYADTDNDGFGSTTTMQACIMPEGYTNNNEDCADEDASIHPQATEICDTIDNNCDTLIDDDDPLLDISSTTTWFVDNDGDGQGNIYSSLQSCAAPADYVDNAMDCDDSDEFIYFGNAGYEAILGCYIDNDQDGFGDSLSQNTSTNRGSDCDDTLAYINPMATEIPGDGIDQDCDGNDSLVQMPDFSLPDENPYSATYGQTISVRDQLQRISGWYFIKAT